MTAPAPDITRDRIVVFMGAATTTFDHAPEMLFPAAADVILMDGLPPAVENPPKLYFRPKVCCVRIQPVVGTVKEIAEDFETKLTRTFNALTLRQDDGTHPVIPAFGEASLRKQTEALAASCGDRFHSSLPLVSPDAVMGRANFEQTAAQLSREMALSCAVNSFLRLQGGGDCPGIISKLGAQRLRDALTQYLGDAP